MNSEQLEILHEKEKFDALVDVTDDVNKKRFMLCEVSRNNGKIEYELLIVDPYLTFSVGMSQEAAINFIKSFPKL